MNALQLKIFLNLTIDGRIYLCLSTFDLHFCNMTHFAKIDKFCNQLMKHDNSAGLEIILIALLVLKFLILESY